MSSAWSVAPWPGGVAGLLFVLVAAGTLSGHYFLFRSYEEHLARALDAIGPVVAVGSPREDPRTPELGAARLYLRDEAWQYRVDGLIRDAGLVVLHAGTSAGLLWELHRVIAANRPDRLIVSGGPVAANPTQAAALRLLSREFRRRIAR